jgi:hypothetical protein
MYGPCVIMPSALNALTAPSAALRTPCAAIPCVQIVTPASISVFEESRIAIIPCFHPACSKSLNNVPVNCNNSRVINGTVIVNNCPANGFNDSTMCADCSSDTLRSAILSSIFTRAWRSCSACRFNSATSFALMSRSLCSRPEASIPISISSPTPMAIRMPPMAGARTAMLHVCRNVSSGVLYSTITPITTTAAPTCAQFSNASILRSNSALYELAALLESIETRRRRMRLRRLRRKIISGATALNRVDDGLDDPRESSRT